MAWYCILGALAAFGLLCGVWVVFGWLLSGGTGGAVVCLPCGNGQEALFLRRCRWLRELGLLRCPVLLVDTAGTALPEETEICSPEELLTRLELERNRIDGTGNGNPSGHHRGGGVPEL